MGCCATQAARADAAATERAGDARARRNSKRRRRESTPGGDFAELVFNVSRKAERYSIDMRNLGPSTAYSCCAAACLVLRGTRRLRVISFSAHDLCHNTQSPRQRRRCGDERMVAVCSPVAMEVAITTLPMKKQALREAFAALPPTLIPSSRPL
uniref:Uncharacterized protein n=1 Tax=Oryza sativa subsp. japonica TaxID=39947 RepID=Q651V9_ORYSJ|nr:hypothetical protein [Oryza sativa Japonica Group]